MERMKSQVMEAGSLDFFEKIGDAVKEQETEDSGSEQKQCHGSGHFICLPDQASRCIPYLPKGVPPFGKTGKSSLI
jgi:hypothetical protein